MRNINSANDYGWEVLSDEAWDALDMWIDTVGEEAALEDISLAMGEDSLEKTLKYIIRNYDLSEYVEDYDDIWDTFEAVKELLGVSELLDAVAKASGYDELSECLAYIFRQNDFREWQERKGEEIESSRTIKSARFIIEDENGEVIASADTYEEAESVGGMKIIDTQSKGIQSSSVGDIHDKYVLGDITKKTALQKLKELVGIEKAETLLDKWQQTCVTSKRINSSVEKAVREAEEYFGTEASDRTVTCQDILTNKDNEAVADIADKNGVDVKIGKFSVTFYEKPDYEERV